MPVLAGCKVTRRFSLEVSPLKEHCGLALLPVGLITGEFSITC